MRSKKLLIFGTLLLGGIGFSQNYSISVAPYFTYIGYSGSGIKKNGYVGTLLTTLGLNYGKDVFNFAYAYTHLSYKNNYGSWNQNDYTLTYTTYRFYPWTFSVGYHLVKSPNDDFSRTGNIPFIYVGYGQRYLWDAGVFVSYSDYKQGVGAFQTQLRGGFYRWQDYYSGFYYGADLTWINVKGLKTLMTTKRNYISVGGGITKFKIGKYSIGGRAWIGQRMLMVDNGGFVVYNLRERYSFGADATATYYLNKQLSVTGMVGYAHYKEVETNNSVDTYTITLSVGYSF
jgi:hypothetical protein